MSPATPPYRYVVALGSNRRGRYGSPTQAITVALEQIGGVRAVSPVIATAPLGPSIRRFANAAAVVETVESPPALLARLKRIERALGRRAGRRWGARAIDLDIVLWSGGQWRRRSLMIPHAAYAARAFVLTPVTAIAPDWRDPPTGRTMRQMSSLVDRRRPST
ncbi:2-amino-4-hydroxy-6-hydroxymethyldihydropteridine diphosphokinase [Microvirga sp. SRT01]|uniref:2-amino-4-hydroxy-6-hydroxymethyldihydropteridine pyrophosphokinase n=1 Tax=Sphingomonas longa TaxID=2778730 RepID=A0ABS2D698_9SPHN|nr:2-amino-4-hydroxy-6-hydroxymethyldihydropteridine diphosphokinase [Microvirga sp. SRT01]MBM6576440.1 2-amino-4-hydroxy-6-hydroxymethyldihydropteridine diphosphokinase [Sphingomonas sp. BT552]MBR7709486.1 2-amino-4-hydroxy-6-hydroxymethyldihydropteridine diphosphokinase [Microvirga sp. SRT01]